MQKKYFKIQSEKNFGVTFGTVSLLFSSYLYIIQSYFFSIIFIITSLFFFVIAFSKPVFLKWPNYIWYRFGLLLSSIVSPLVLFLMYTLTIVPIGLIMKIIKGDIIDAKIDKNAKTYWKNTTTNIQDMKKQF